MAREELVVHGAREHNLKDTTVRLPRNALVVSERDMEDPAMARHTPRTLGARMFRLLIVLVMLFGSRAAALGQPARLP